ncbi:hypothetical protein BOX15_Mlig002953g4 [Macrostomum lignano]|uniref:Protein YIPF3 n=3 Tax=Macrostomum lignano TaxID=282301 RepID=A0A1I8FZK9_9PLAT|nr:hypothetical protein BOX15_Mlig006829g4 [Macrostomum lignano]PAA53522.1 hypothetical protein BOX15_Mlig006829g2 [Macrostomum lignano]PAA93062.1 hypothetical protein BOX15_Mlig002953g4 [Macrostomum lignano]
MKASPGTHDSAVIDMDDVEMTVESDNAPRGQQQQQQQQQGGPDLYKAIRDNMSSIVWQEGTKKAKTAISSYANVDLLRPYFDVQPMEVANRLLFSFVPARVSNDANKIHSELYGPVMTCFTLVAVLLYEMKSSDHRVQEGTLMGSAMITVFGYWLGVSALVWLVAYICNAQVKPIQVATLIGYALTSHVAVVLLTTFFHSTQSHKLFYLLWAVLGGLTTLKLVSTFVVRTPGHTERIVLCALVAILHMLFLLYLHFAYHKIVSDLSEVLEQKIGMHHPVAQVGANKPPAAAGSGKAAASAIGAAPLMPKAS